MFKTYVGALSGEEGAPSSDLKRTQGIVVHFKNVSIAPVSGFLSALRRFGKSFRNEITPRNFTFRSREFEQMGLIFFCHPQQSQAGSILARSALAVGYTELGLSGERLRLRDHHTDELSHYSTGTADIEYAFPFLPEGSFGELEGLPIGRL